jgi:hypothetical protein
LPGVIIRPMCVHVWRRPGLGHNVTFLFHGMCRLPVALMVAVVPCVVL